MGSFPGRPEVMHQSATIPGPQAGRVRVLLTVVASFSPRWLGVNHLIALFIVFKILEETFGSI